MENKTVDTVSREKDAWKDFSKALDVLTEKICAKFDRAVIKHDSEVLRGSIATLTPLLRSRSQLEFPEKNKK